MEAILFHINLPAQVRRGRFGTSSVGLSLGAEMGRYLQGNPKRSYLYPEVVLIFTARRAGF